MASYTVKMRNGSNSYSEEVFICLNVLKPQTPDKCPLMRKNDGEFYHSKMYSIPWHNQQQCIHIYVYILIYIYI